MRTLAKPFVELFKARNIIFQTAMNDLKARYAGSAFGIAWMVIYPLLFLACYAFVYAFVLRVGTADLTGLHYVAFIFSGLVPYLGFSESVSSTTSSVVANISLLKNTLFPIEYVPVKAVIVSLPTQICGFAIILIALPFLGRMTWAVPLFLVVWVLQILFQIGLGWMLSAVNVFFRDIQNLVGIVLMMLMMTSPIPFPPGSVSGGLGMLLMINPLYYIIVPYQQLLIYGALPSPFVMIMLAAMSLFFFIAGYYFFRKTKRMFADYV